MVELDYDQVLEELINFDKKTDVELAPSYPEILDRYLEIVARNGDIIFPWSKVKPFIRQKLDQVMDSFNRDNPLTEPQIRVPNCKPFIYADLKNEILKSFDWFYAAPFTIQRLCELLINPDKHYHRTDKFMRGIEKNVLVVSTVQPRPNKYSTQETNMEKQSPFKDIFSPNFNSLPTQNHNHSSSTSSASGVPVPSPGAGVMLNGSHEPVNHGPNNSYDGPNASPYHPLVPNSFYDQAPPPPPLNNHHSHLLESMNSDLPSNHLHPHHPHHANSHHPHPHPHPPPHHSTLAPLQQLDSFTNVFTTSTTHHHLGHLNSNYGPLEGGHLTNGTSAWSQESALKHGGSPYDSLLSQSVGSISHNNHEPLNNSNNHEDNENIVVDDDEEEAVKQHKSNGAKDEKDASFHYANDSSNSTAASDASFLKSDISIEKADQGANPTAEQQTDSTPTSSEQLAAERSAAELTPKKRPSPTPPLTDAPEEFKVVEGVAKDEAELSLTPKKLRVQEEQETKQEPESSTEETTVVEPAPSVVVASKVVNVEVKESVVLSGETIATTNGEEVIIKNVIVEAVQLTTTTVEQDDSTPMDQNGAEEDPTPAPPPMNSIVPEANNGICKQAEDIAMQSTSQTEEESNDQVMDEPMDQE